jgi:ornithine cyclodeaminase/alanine dehydrogenase-like protein (mu-crystallin family)
MPPRLHFEVDGGVMLFMPCAIAGDPICGVKIVTVSREARAGGRVNASYILLDANTGNTVAMFAANHLTDMRTAATSAIATALLARTDATTLGVFGTGRQAKAHIRVLPRVRRFQRILVCGSTLHKAKEFAERMQLESAIEIAATDAVNVASHADVICTCTNSVDPLFDGILIRPGTHLNLIGTFQPHAREVDSSLIWRSRVFVDTHPGALAEAGDILVPLHAGEIQHDHIRGDLHEVLSGAKPGRLSEDDITTFKSVGCALEDLVTAKLVMQALR